MDYLVHVTKFLTYTERLNLRLVYRMEDPTYYGIYLPDSKTTPKPVMMMMEIDNRQEYHYTISNIIDEAYNCGYYDVIHYALYIYPFRYIGRRHNDIGNVIINHYPEHIMDIVEHNLDIFVLGHSSLMRALEKKCNRRTFPSAVMNIINASAHKLMKGDNRLHYTYYDTFRYFGVTSIGAPDRFLHMFRENDMIADGTYSRYVVTNIISSYVHTSYKQAFTDARNIMRSPYRQIRSNIKYVIPYIAERNPKLVELVKSYLDGGVQEKK